MTNKKAHKYLENLQRELTSNRYLYSDELIEANGLGILALEKQIPIPPKKVEEVSFLELDNGSRYEILSLCPGCSVPFIGCIPKYCSACGQAIDGGNKK